MQNAGNHCYVLFAQQIVKFLIIINLILIQKFQDDSFIHQENIKLLTKLAAEKQKCIFVNTGLAEKPNDIPDDIRIVKYRSILF